MKHAGTGEGVINETSMEIKNAVVILMNEEYAEMVTVTVWMSGSYSGHVVTVDTCIGGTSVINVIGNAAYFNKSIIVSDLQASVRTLRLGHLF